MEKGLHRCLQSYSQWHLSWNTAHKMKINTINTDKRITNIHQHLRSSCTYSGHHIVVKLQPLHSKRTTSDVHDHHPERQAGIKYYKWICTHYRVRSSLKLRLCKTLSTTNVTLHVTSYIQVISTIICLYIAAMILSLKAVQSPQTFPVPLGLR